MSRLVAGIYPDPEQAAHAADVLRRAGFSVAKATEQVAGLSDDERGRALIVNDPDDREAEVRSLFMETGAARLQGHGTEGTGISATPAIGAEDPVPVEGGERPPSDFAGSSSLPGGRRKDQVGRQGSADGTDADPRYEIINDAADDEFDKLELEERLRRGPLSSGPPR